MNQLLHITLSLFLILPLQACLVSGAIGVVAETVEAGAEITGAVIGTAVDIVIPGGDDDEKDRNKKQLLKFKVKGLAETQRT